ncbi:MAG: porin family protein [Planctomycetota bacterium]|jgi:hypothetical protein
MKKSVIVLMMTVGFLVNILNGQDVSMYNRVLEQLYIDAGISLGLTFGIGTVLEGGDLPVINGIPVLADLRYDVGIKFEQFGSRWGDSEDFNGSESSSTYKFRFNYLSFPLLVEYMLCEAYLMGGLKPRILLGATETWKFKDVYTSGDMRITDTHSGEEDIKHDIKTLDFGLMFGAGYPFSWRDYNFRVEAKYEIGLRDIWDGSDSGSNGSSDFSLKNNNFNLTFAWQLGL